MIYSGQALHPLPTATVVGIPSSATSVAGLVDDATVARIDAEPDRPLSWQPGSDPAMAELVADRFGEQTVARSVDPLLGGVYAGSAATIGLRAAAPSVAAALDRGAASLTDAVRRGLPPASGGPVFGAMDGGYQVLLDELVARSRVRWVRTAVTASSVPSAAGRCTMTPAPLARRRGGPGHPGPAAGALGLRPGPEQCAAASRIASASSAVVALAVPADTAFPENSGVLVASGEPLRAKAITLSSQNGAAQGACNCCGCRSGGSATTWPPPPPTTSCWPGRPTTWPRCSAWTSTRSMSGCSAGSTRCRSTGPATPMWSREVRAGLPPGLAVAGSYLDGIGVPACIGGGRARGRGPTKREVAR